ncbi:5-oxoprolinase subunit B family protein [Portibacter lacus]|uniref:Allophanate hydrolase n=1 Tax=Portibacter lacus TaxID=1099794 RepID=A0AA37SNI5_9BACT|nr:carboxyltransferase domain-containing protein [Portibacter lacus]GLR18023.1 allophanate hydrolase [Portibacter lacus]
MDDSLLHIDNYNDDFLIITSDEHLVLRALGLSIFEQNFEFVNEVIVTEAEICLQLNSKFHADHLAEIKALKVESGSDRTRYKLPVYFDDGEDWTFVESFSGLTKAQVIKELVTSELNISMFGFLPGFMYLSGLKKAIQIPRKSVPSKYVKSNSIALGGKYLGLYAIDSPGGWHVIGKTPISILDITGLPPVPMNLEDQVQIVEISKLEFEKIKAEKMTLGEYNRDL